MAKKKKPIIKLVLITGGVTFIAILVLISWRIHNLGKTNASPSSNGVICTREEPYELPLEFERARSLRSQRLQEAGVKLDYSFYNCIDIQYADLAAQGAEGMFRIDQNSSLDHLMILVDNGYKIKDDVFTAILLSHEFTHVAQYVRELKGEGKTSCVEAEVEAFLNEIVFITELNKEEKVSLASRITYYKGGGYNDSISLGIISQIDDLIKMKGQSSDLNTLKNLIDKWVRSNPAYQKQCNLQF